MVPSVPGSPVALVQGTPCRWQRVAPARWCRALRCHSAATRMGPMVARSSTSFTQQPVASPRYKGIVRDRHTADGREQGAVAAGSRKRRYCRPEGRTQNSCRPARWLLNVQQSDSVAARQRARHLTDSLESIANILNRNEQLVRMDAHFCSASTSRSNEWSLACGLSGCRGRSGFSSGGDSGAAATQPVRAGLSGARRGRRRTLACG